MFGSVCIRRAIIRIVILAAVLSVHANPAVAATITVNWTGTAVGIPGSLSAWGSFTVDSSLIFEDIVISSLPPLVGFATDGVNTFSTTAEPGGPNNIHFADHEMGFRFTSTDLSALAGELVDLNPFDNQNDSVDFQFWPWVSFSGGSCECEVAILVLYGTNANNPPSPFFVSAAPYDLRGSYSFSFDVEEEPAPVPEPASLLLFGSGLVSLRAWRKRRG